MPSATFRAGRYAIIDIGTVTVRMLVADVDACGTIREVTRQHRICDLGEGVDETGILSQQAMNRVIDAIDQFQIILHELDTAEHPLCGLRAYATSASRDAHNASEFRGLLRQHGVILSVISGKREAALSFAGASMRKVGQQVVVFDVGGGSTEIIAGVGGREPQQLRSFDIGCRRITERFFASDVPIDAELRAASDFVKNQMGPFFMQLRHADLLPAEFVGVAGTVTSAVAVRVGMERYDRSVVDGFVLSRLQLGQVFDRLRMLPLSARREVTGLEPKRAPVIVAGLLIALCVLDLAGETAFVVSETDLLHGAILDVAATQASASGGRHMENSLPS